MQTKPGAYFAPTAESPLILPMSSIALFRKCRKAFELGYARNINPGTSSEAADKGTMFHAMMAYAGDRAQTERVWTDDDEMLPVAKAYLKMFPLPKDIISIEQPLYTRIRRAVYVRTTFDLVYRDENGWIVGRDYKTFEKSPAYDVDLDFQGRMYIAALMKAFKTDQVRFEYEYVRRVPPGTKNSKGVWSPDECYINVPLVISNREAKLVWDEATATVADIVTARRKGGLAFYRGGTRKEFGSPCLGCFYANLCKAEMQLGVLTDEDVVLLAAGFNEPLSLPSDAQAPRSR